MPSFSVRRLSAALVAGLFAAASLLAAGPALAAPAPACSPDGTPSSYLCAQTGDLVDVRIGDVLPTQPSLGYDEVYYKLGRYTMGKDTINKKFDDWCEANGQGETEIASASSTLADPSSFTCTIAVGDETDDSISPMKTVVIGPGGTLYLTDGHHTLTSFAETPDAGLDTHVRLRVLGNLSQLSTDEFWNTMIENKWVWLRDVDGNAVDVADLPTGVGLSNFADDKYRSVMYFGRDIGYTAGTIPFQEFYWGAWLRNTGAVDLSGWNANDPASYLATVKAITQAQTALAPDEVVDSGKTAQELGRLDEWNDGKKADKGEFDKLSVPYSEDKPGKIAYAVAYKETVPAPSVPEAPAAPSAAVDGSDVTISWTAPSNGGSPVTGYRVSLNGASPVVVSAGTRSHTFTGLAAGDYSATVVAVNVAGASAASPASASVTVAGTHPPVDPTAVRGTLSVAGTLEAGGRITVTGTGFAESTAGYALSLHSTPVALGTVSTDAAGRFDLAATIPDGIASGSHSVVATLNGIDVASLSITVSSAFASASSPVTEGADAESLARTGVDGLPGIAALAAALVLFGAAAIAVRRKTNAPSWPQTSSDTHSATRGYGPTAPPVEP